LTALASNGRYETGWTRNAVSQMLSLGDWHFKPLPRRCATRPYALRQRRCYTLNNKIMSFLKKLFGGKFSTTNIYYVNFHYQGRPDKKYTTRVDTETEEKARKETARKEGKAAVIDSVELQGTKSSAYNYEVQVVNASTPGQLSSLAREEQRVQRMNGSDFAAW
jgi:hypothetical protein